MLTQAQIIERVQDASALGSLYNLLGIANRQFAVFTLFPASGVRNVDGLPQFGLEYEGQRYACRLTRIAGPEEGGTPCAESR